MRFNKLWILLTLFMFGFLMQAYDIHADCCVDYSIEQCEAYYPPEECNAPAIPFAESCGAIFESQCTDGCCCVPSGGGTLVWNSSCQDVGGTFHSFPTSLSECNNFCNNGGQLSTYHLSGFVSNDTHLRVSNVSVTLLDRGNANVNTTDGSNGPPGMYNFPTVEAGNSLTIFAQKGDCSATVSISPFSQDTEKNITLSCCEYTFEYGECIDGYRNKTYYAVNSELCEIDEYTESNIACTTNLCEWDCTDWDPQFSDPENPNLQEPCPPPYTQRTRECVAIETGNCEVGPDPDLIIECGISLDDNCGNGDIDAGEECDFLQEPPFTGRSNCPEGRRTFDWCTPECTCKLPDPITGCNINDPSYPNEIDAEGVSGERKINVSWPLVGDCSDYVNNYEVFGCMNVSGSCSFINVSNLLPKNVDEFMVLNHTWFELIERTKYCFKLETTFNNSIPGKKKYNSTSVCMDMGDNACLGPHDLSWCGNWGGNDAVLTCNSENDIIPSPECPAGEYCGVGSTGPQCMKVSKCDRCNGLFGIFGYQGFTIPLFENEELTCPTLVDRTGSLSTPGPTGCFLDYSYTSVDRVYNCTSVNSCYDYKSRLSCESDYCRAFQAGVGNFDNKCEWADYNVMFNKGVCRPKKEYVDTGLAIQNCALCNDPFYNRIYGDCTQDTCSLYGYCYFKKSTGECTDGYAASCDVYENQEDCIGDSAVSVDTIWNVDGTQKIGGTNILLEESDDELEILRCEWDGTKCYRNADNLPDDPNDIGVDCRMVDLEGNYNTTICERDITPPVTTVSPNNYYGEYIDLRDEISISDSNAWPLGDNYSDTQQNRKHVWIYYSIYDRPRYPNRVLRITGPIEEQNYKINVLQQIPDSMEETGNMFYFFYFAEDPARNLEVVKNFSFILDITEPYVTLSTRLESYQGEFDWGNWSTNLFVNISLSAEISMPVECFYNITPIFNKELYWEPSHDESNIPSASPPNYNLIETVPGSLTSTYFELWPDRYNYEFKCLDAVGNMRGQTGTFTLDGDLTINGPFPIETTYTTETLPHNISINTTADGICRYSRTTTDYTAMEYTYIKRDVGGGNYLHYSPITTVFANEIELGGIPSKIYKIYSACDLIINGQHKIVSGGSPDIIRFAVDDLPPITRLTYDLEPGMSGGEENFTNNQTTNLLHLYLDNDDYSPLLDDGQDMSFNANSTYYCINTSEDCDIVEYDLENRQPIIFDYTVTGPGSHDEIYGPYPEFCYYSLDNGMNLEQEKCIRLKLRNMLFLEPDINITVR